jgi:hypothetical protein
MPDIRETWPLRGLTRGEVKKLRAEGIDLARLDAGNADEAVDRVVALVLSPDLVGELDDRPCSETMRVFQAILEETYGFAGEEKNSPAPGTDGGAGRRGAPSVVRQIRR